MGWTYRYELFGFLLKTAFASKSNLNEQKEIQWLYLTLYLLRSNC